MIIAIGSTNEDKISGIQLGLESLKSGEVLENLNEYQLMIRKIIEKEFGGEIILDSYKTDSGVSDLPKTLEETVIGSRNRALNLIEIGINADYYVGTEGGIHNIFDRFLLYSAVCIMNSKGNSHYGTSNGIELPKTLVQKILSGNDLSNAFKKQHNIIPKGSISGALSMGEFSREKQFMDAFNTAMKPFHNKEYY